MRQYLTDNEPDARWRAVIGYEGRYQVSSCGRVRSLLRSDTMPHLLRFRPTEGGYQRVSLCANGAVKDHRVHHLVLEAFVGPQPKGLQCRHLDGNPANNLLDNLRWGTRRENEADKVRHGTVARGESHGRAKLTEPDILRIRSMTGSLTELAGRFGVAFQTISAIKNRKIWRHI